MNIHAGIGGFILSKRKGKGNIRVAVERRTIGPTPERLAKAGDDAIRTVGADGARVVVMRDDPLNRWYKLNIEEVDPVEYQALQKFKWHWYAGNLAGSPRSSDLNRVFASDASGMSHMPQTERQAHHRQQWRNACEKLSHQELIVVDNVVCYERTLEIAGYAIGKISKRQATAAAKYHLIASGGKLARLWGMYARA